MQTQTCFSTPQLRLIHSGKVRDSYRVDDTSRLIVVSDRLSAFDSVLGTAIPKKGEVLNRLANFWFSRTEQIVNNHVIRQIDPRMTLVKEALPVKVEVIVRGYLTGSMWRAYQAGVRYFCGQEIPEGMTMNQKFDHPLVTPTTKGEKDEEISPDGIVAAGLASREVWQKMRDVSLELFKFGTDLLAEKRLILCDTKYEFGLIDGALVLIDEIHTPDSSRIWPMESWENDPATVEQLDKEYVRQWLISQKKDGLIPDVLPDDVRIETSRRYVELYERVTDSKLEQSGADPAPEMFSNLVDAQLVKDGYVALVMGSAMDMDHATKLKKLIEQYDIRVMLQVMSAHKNGEVIGDLAERLNSSVEPGAVIAIAGLSNGLGGALSANLNIPVINCPPFKNEADIILNVNSSLMMPSKAPASTVIKPANAVQAALRALNLPRLRQMFTEEIKQTKQALKEQNLEAEKL